ncbi:MAG: hypothetical protein A2840_02435 [Candidatus Buchananbacteria bacterium RIFCSPHIGHO2_01_FULL_47_11b]|uniref:Peptidase S11 D-alanyl-D-alanine carboxypeptidase A N-terminal domain-containing protein n=1 Tax=Candidatus Buchananbacteria bacterium RIFCSPHIGHO2_01_FULL_47_11b TaxID=1797537 RepID=A0A1G1Y6W6_9BACT|nr:MAG: hypothetical protein A2840_02435 [Candidatus Buchananbacteria bacterium RIFCSPHIGHO2_01_FULL_47_11b]
MQKKFFYLLLLVALLPLPVAADSLADSLAGKILLQVESYGRAWYVHPVEKTRYYLQNGATAYKIMRQESLGITDADLSKIRTAYGQPYDRKLTERLKGYILLQVEENGEAWYVNPSDGLRYYLRDGEAAYEIMRELSLGISNKDLDTISVTEKQIVSSYTFDDVAYTGFDGQNYFGQHQADEILPIASLTKLITAMVVLDHFPVWDRLLTITPEQINYPTEYVGDDATSEVDIAAGQKISVADLWVAMLLASSNQSAVALAESTGLTRAEFVVAMNEKVRSLGLEKTVIFDIAGLDAHNVSTAKEMAVIARAAFAIPEIREATVKNEYQMAIRNADGTSSETEAVNRNYSLLKFNPEATKTGFLIEAQRNVVLQKNGSIIVVLHARSMTERNRAIEELLN